MATLQDIQFHYDTGNDLFTLFLDREHKMYSCAVWQDCSTLEAAQTKKLDRIAKFANVKPGDRVLDVGCGWGGMLIYLLDKFKAKEPTGLTLSQEQFNFIKSLDIAEIDIEICSWSDFRESKAFDAIVSIGAFEHFASLDDKANNTHIDVYRNFFRCCHNLSRESSSLGLQTIVFNRVPSNLRELKDAKYLLEKVFPGSSLPTIEEIQLSMSSFYRVEKMMTIGQDYARTLSEWKIRLCNNESIVVERYSRELFDHYLTYFDSAKRNFEDGVVELAQFSLERIN
jgi:cyclopropane-fatty-acyl-phospholipid synthase